jgi:dihydrofolate synthase/folylpolyglutamate synthase
VCSSDLTNVVTPVACAITRIDYDHTDKLGRTLDSIAGENAGIVKAGVPVITSEPRPAARRVILRRARAVGAPVFEPAVADVPRRLSVLGEHQRENASVAIALAGRVTALKRRAIAKVLANVRIPGRLEVVRPGWIVDVAHNPFAMRATAAALPPARRRIVIFGVSRDKNWRAMMRALGADLWILTKASNPRACPPSELARHVPGPSIEIGSVARAVKLAEKLARKGDQILITGSFYVAGEAYRALKSRAIMIR